MKIKKKFILTPVYAGCFVLLVSAWIIALGAKSDTEKQQILITRAQELIEKEIYIMAAPLLEEAAGLDAVHTLTAEEELKKVYLALSDNRGYSRLYAKLLDKQMGREDASYEVFIEAAEYYIGKNAYAEAMALLRQGIKRTESIPLTDYYEKMRYATELSRAVFADMTEIVNGYAGVETDGKWGIAAPDGTPVIPCIYEKVSTVYNSRIVVLQNGEIFAVDMNNNRVAVVPEGVRDFGNFGDNRLGLLTDEGWVRASGEFTAGTAVFEDIGMYSGGYAAVKAGGRWGVIDIGNDRLIPAEYDGIITDGPGRCFGQGSVFVRSGESVWLYTEGKRIDGVYQDAKPFTEEGWAAAARNGKWGYIDTAGNVMIDFIYDDALSFDGHLAAVKLNGLWGYINTSGEIVIDAVFADVKSFSSGSAPVLTEKGWQFLILKEFKKESKLL